MISDPEFTIYNFISKNMLRKTGSFTIYLLIFFVVLSFVDVPFGLKKTEPASKKDRVENHLPVVKINSPKNNSAFSSNALVSYDISVSDKEDGESKYQEINAKEVFLEIKYVKDTSGAIAEIKKAREDPPGLAIIKMSNCMNCHAFKTKLIGPSFYEIQKRYQHDDHDSLANHILNGSKGRWGDVQMPSNTKLNLSEASKVIQWIFKNAGDSTINFFAGLEGSFRLNPPDATFKDVILVASYTDHGSPDQPSKNLKGEDIILIHENN
jgi:cytochrome c